MRVDKRAMERSLVTVFGIKKAHDDELLHSPSFPNRRAQFFLVWPVLQRVLSRPLHRVGFVICCKMLALSSALAVRHRSTKAMPSHHHSTSLFFLVPFQSPLPCFQPFQASSASQAPEPSANLRLTRQCSPSRPLLNLHRTRTKLEPGCFSSNRTHYPHSLH